MRRMALKYDSWTKEALISRIRQLENAQAGEHVLPSARASRIAGEIDETAPGTPVNTSGAAIQAPIRETKKLKKSMDFSKYSKRFVAIRFAYLGWNYHGLAFQKDQKHGNNTVEGEILKAFYKTKCIEAIDPTQCNFSRCGRTDADVSAMAQVIALELRSNIPKEDQNDPANDHKELDYLRILNSSLPSDIIAYEICLRPPEEFDARFSCLARHYRYYFWGGDLDIEAMNDAAKRLLGPDRDFRNFCRIDPTKQITNFKRTILEADIRSASDSRGMFYLNLKGTAFLWNQVRSIMAILFLVGQRYESPDIIDKLLNVDILPCRPVYEIAWGVPLVLYNCYYPEGIEWQTSSFTRQDKILTIWHEHLQKMNMAQTMIDTLAPPRSSAPTEEGINTGRGISRRSKYLPLMQRPRTEPPEVINARWLAKQESKQD